MPIATPMLLVASQMSQPIPEPALALKSAAIASVRKDGMTRCFCSMVLCASIIERVGPFVEAFFRRNICDTPSNMAPIAIVDPPPAIDFTTDISPEVSRMMTIVTPRTNKITPVVVINLYFMFLVFCCRSALQLSGLFWRGECGRRF